MKTGAEVLERGTFARGTGPIYLSDLNCDGMEARLLDCLRLDNQPTGLHTCEHHEDVAIRCTGKQKQNKKKSENPHWYHIILGMLSRPKYFICMIY